MLQRPRWLLLAHVIRVIKKISKLFVSIVVLGAVALSSTAALAQEEEVVVDDTAVVPAEVIATTEPVYFGGFPAYWWNGRWVFRDHHGHWAYYRHEPRVLMERRMHAPPPRRYYGGGPGYRGRPMPVMHRR